MSEIVEIQLWQFGLVSLLLLIVAAVMKKCKINKTKLLIVASVRMSVQLVLAGLILTYIFKNPKPVFTILYILIMTAFAIYRIISKKRRLNIRFKLIIGFFISVTGLLTLIFFICAVVGESIFNPQYVIPIAGMIMGNTMTGVSLGIKTFCESLSDQRPRINTLLCIGASPKRILFPFVTQALETALLPTMNTMLGMGVVSLPGMMTGQILSGTLPTTAIIYQISIMISICTAVCLSCFGSLYFGYRTLYTKSEKIIYLP